MRRGLVLLAIFFALAVAPSGQAASWARPQIQTVVANGLMGPSVAEFRPGQPVTRGDIGQAIAVLTGVDAAATGQPAHDGPAGQAPRHLPRAP